MIFFAASIVIGLIIGMLYGLLFVRQHQTRAFHHTSFFLILFQTLPQMAIRLFLLAIAWTLLLHTTTINFILTLVTFFAAFWLTVFQQKAVPHERS